MTSLQSSTKSLMDTYTEQAWYTVYELTSNGLVFTSQFSSKSDAKYFVKKFGMKTSTLYIYKSNCIKMYEPLEESEQEQEQEQNLVCLVDEEYNSDEDADYVPEEEEEEEEEEVLEQDSYDTDLSNMRLEKYGRGYLLIPPTENEYYGEAYFYDGWWIAKQGGWFFKAEFYDSLVQSGVQLEEEHLVDNEDTHGYELSLQHMTISQYGKGYMLKTVKSDELYGMDYLLEVGFWNKRAKGWFFKTEHLDMLLNLGAKMLKTEEKSSYVSDDDEFTRSLRKPSFVKHGRAWLLKQNEHYVYNESMKYYEGGFYNASLNGWIFKTADKNAFLKQFE